MRRERVRNFERPPEIGYGQTRPEDMYAALMEAKPGDDPELSKAELLPLRDVIADALDQLPDHERWAFEALVIRRLSERELARELARPRRTVRRWRDQAVTHLQVLLSTHPLILEHLHRGEFDE